MFWRHSPRTRRLLVVGFVAGLAFFSCVVVWSCGRVVVWLCGCVVAWFVSYGVLVLLHLFVFVCLCVCV